MHLLRFPLLLVALVFTRAFAAALPAESTVTAATIYPDRAVVTRTATAVEVPAVTSEITFAQLPAALLDESVQVTAKGSVPATLLDIVTRIGYITAEPDARFKTLEDQLLTLRREERALNDQGSVLESQRALLTSIEKVSTTPVASRPGETPSARPALEDYEKLLGFSASQRARFDAAAQKLDFDRSTLAEKVADTQAQLNELRGKQPSRRAQKTVTVRLSTEAAGKLDLALSYGLPGASWTPAYDARLRSEKRQVQLDAFGLVRNGTGEDWKAITLTLSTARPGLGGAAPEIAPWLLDIIQPVAYGKMKSSSMALDRSMAKSGGKADAFSNSLMMEALPPPPGSGAAPEAAVATLAVAQIDAAATSASFKIATPVTLASDNTAQRLPLGSATLAAELQYQSTPKLQDSAYLAAYVTNRSELPFLAGALNVFLDDTFVATARLATTMPGEKFTLNLGADEGITIKRKIISRFTEDTGFTTKSRRTTYDILVTVTNNKRTAERVVIKDVAPVARDEKIVVNLIAPAARELLKPEEAAVQPPKVGIARDAEGKLTWRLDLKPGEKREIPLKFSVEHPADLTVTGIE